MTLTLRARWWHLPFVVLSIGCCTCAAARVSGPARQAGGAQAQSTAPSTGTIRFGDAAQQRDLAPFFPETTYDKNIPAPDAMLRQPLGTFTAHHAEILAYLRALETKSTRIKVTTFGHTHEGRDLVSAVIGLPENIQKLEQIKTDLGKLADPRKTDAIEAEHIIKTSPAIAWLGYSIHGDEMSGSDASMAVAYQLVAGTSADVTDLLKQVVVVIDPSLNPDGRERILSQLEQGAGYVPNLDADSMSRGRWPYGRGNHYLFDMNRDWIWGTQPETRARWAAISAFHPQLLVDAHEMGALDSYLFYPATDPLTHYFPEHTKKWWTRFGNEQAAAFDKHGWSYYTREWADSWYPGYTDSWATFIGAVGILYEQARFHGQSVKRASGEIATYREAVQRQATGSLSNVATLAKNREEMLRDYFEAKKKNCASDTAGNDRMFVLAPGRNYDREARFVGMLAAQGIEIFKTDAGFKGKHVETAMQGKLDDKDFAAGSLLILARQPLSPMVKAYLEFDPRYDIDSLNRERKELERKQRSKAYDVTAWSPAHAFDLDAYWCDAQDVAMKAIRELAPREKGVVPLAKADEPVYGWCVDGNEDAAVVFAARAMELGLQVEITEEAFSASGRKFPRGSLLVRRHENGADVAEKVAKSADAAGTRAWATGTARSPDESPDLGGQHFKLLARPRVALMSNSPISTDSFGHTWNLIDTWLGIPVTLIDAQGFGGYDLRRYNVLIVPDGGGIGTILKENAESLATWVKNGGTLIASGGSAAAIADKELKLSSVRLRPEALDDLDKYAVSVKHEREAGKKPIDEAALWDGKPSEKKTASEAGQEKKDDKGGDKADASVARADAKADAIGAKDGKDDKDDGKSASKGDEDKKRRDRWMRTFSPQGVILRSEVNPDAWITAGCGDELPVYYDGSNVFLSELPVRTPVRLASADRLRLSGLLWPEARERLADGAWCTVESQGAGQVILFAVAPDYRNWFRGTMRLMANAIVYGPGVGASQPTAW